MISQVKIFEQWLINWPVLWSSGKPQRLPMMAVLDKAEQISAQSVQIMILGFGVSTIVDRPVYGYVGGW